MKYKPTLTDESIPEEDRIYSPDKKYWCGKTSKESSDRFFELLEETKKEEIIPTAMEMAWRDAMERAQTQDDEEVKPEQKAIPQENELDDLLTRTLEHQVKTASE